MPIITIDGPSGSGKGTVSKQVAQQLGYHYLDSGAIYRILAHVVSGLAIDPSDSASVVRCAQDLKFSFYDDQIQLDGEDISEFIRTEELGNVASLLAADEAVRACLLKRQRAFDQPPGLIADGRDMGTVVFPQAELKIYLTASAEERARRRYKQLKDKNSGVSLRALEDQIIARDQRDANRTTAPLRPAEDAVEIDSTEMGIDEVVQRIVTLWQQSFLEPS